MTSGRWSVEDNTMIFYDEDNSTVLAKFSLFDEGLKRSEKEVFHRVRNDNDDSTATVLSQVFGKS
jgi:RNase H-fold protein (predicted Holliday junction resolvase)